MVFAAPSKGRRYYDLVFDVAMPGLFEFETDGIKLTDLLHLKTWKISHKTLMKTAILPQETATDNIVIKKAALEEDAENSLTGELSREIRQIREYAPGDKLRDMHWKQTARLDEPMVREVERMREYVGKINTEADLYSTAYWLTEEILERWNKGDTE